MEPHTPFSTPVKSAAADGLNRASLGLNLELRRAISTKLNSLHNAESNLLAESELAKSSRTNMYRNVHQAGK